MPLFLISINRLVRWLFVAELANRARDFFSSNSEASNLQDDAVIGTRI